MKINVANYNLEEFSPKQGMFCGMDATLVIPNTIGTKFTQKNSIFRSSIWDINWNLLSASYKKFVNFGENPDNFPTPDSLDNTTIVEKIDGSAVLIDYVNNIISMRTRGTFSIDTMENAEDFRLCLSKYPKIEVWLKENPNYTLIAEITTPNLRIVIRYGDTPDFWLTGAINKDDYTLMNQAGLDYLATVLDMNRPNIYTFTTISDLLEKVNIWEGKEGVCLYSNKGQTIHKIKAANYLIKHRLKEEFSSLEKVLEFYISEGCPSFNGFQNKIAEVVDWETATEIVSDISRCVDAWKEVSQIINSMKSFVLRLKELGDPKDKKVRGQMAKLVIGSFGNTARNSFVFKLLDSKELDNNDIIKLFWQVLKK
jgi:hypothetical protein